jgi:hypothetical protein
MQAILRLRLLLIVYTSGRANLSPFLPCSRWCDAHMLDTRPPQGL